MPQVLTVVTHLQGRWMFTRRTILVVATGAVLILLFVFGWKEVQIRRAISEVENLNGSIYVPQELLFGPQQVFFDIAGRKAILDDESFRRLLPNLQNFSRLRHLDLCGTQLTARGIEGIGALTTLTKLDLPARCVSEKSIRELATLKRLESLYICGEVTPDLIERLHCALPTTRIHSRDW